MHTDGAQGDFKPQGRIYTGRRASGNTRGYIVLIFILFSVVILLCINNIFVYRSYKGMRSHLEETFRKVSNSEAGRKDLVSSNNRLEKDNNELRERNNAILAQNEEILNQIQVIRKINEELSNKNKELLDDNIELQNTLKKAASVGIKPQNYTSFDGLASRGSLNRGTYVGRFLGTAYTPSKEECGNNRGITNSGEPIIPGISIAIDSAHWPFGTIFYIKGLGYAVAMDTGSAIKGKYRFDFAVLDRSFARTLGQEYWDVYLVKLGNGRVEGLEF